MIPPRPRSRGRPWAGMRGNRHVVHVATAPRQTRPPSGLSARTSPTITTPRSVGPSTLSGARPFRHRVPPRSASPGSPPPDYVDDTPPEARRQGAGRYRRGRERRGRPDLRNGPRGRGPELQRRGDPAPGRQPPVHRWGRGYGAHDPPAAPTAGTGHDIQPDGLRRDPHPRLPEPARRQRRHRAHALNQIPMDMRNLTEKIRALAISPGTDASVRTEAWTRSCSRGTARSGRCCRLVLGEIRNPAP